jgi:hypothetical protein
VIDEATFGMDEYAPPPPLPGQAVETPPASEQAGYQPVSAPPQQSVAQMATASGTAFRGGPAATIARPDAPQVELPPWVAVRDQMRQRFPDLDEETMRRRYEQAYQLNLTRQQMMFNNENRFGQVARNLVPLLPAIEAWRVDRARARLANGNPDPADYATIAQDERRRQLEQGHTFTQNLGLGLISTGRLIGEAAVAGRLVPGGGGTAASGSTMSRVAAGVRSNLGWRGLARTVATPDLWMPLAIANNEANDRPSTSLLGVPVGVGVGMVQNAIFGSLGNALSSGASAASRGFWPRVADTIKAAVVGMAEQQGLDVAESTVEAASQRLLGRGQGLESRWGVAGRFIQAAVSGKGNDWEEALGHTALQFITMSIFAGMHEAGRTPPSTTPPFPTGPSGPGPTSGGPTPTPSPSPGAPSGGPSPGPTGAHPAFGRFVSALNSYSAALGRLSPQARTARANATWQEIRRLNDQAMANGWSPAEYRRQMNQAFPSGPEAVLAGEFASVYEETRAAHARSNQNPPREPATGAPSEPVQPMARGGAEPAPERPVEQPVAAQETPSPRQLSQVQLEQQYAPQQEQNAPQAPSQDQEQSAPQPTPEVQTQQVQTQAPEVQQEALPPDELARRTAEARASLGLDEAAPPPVVQPPPATPIPNVPPLVTDSKITIPEHLSGLREQAIAQIRRMGFSADKATHAVDAALHGNVLGHSARVAVAKIKYPRVQEVIDELIRRAQIEHAAATTRPEPQRERVSEPRPPVRLEDLGIELPPEVRSLVDSHPSVATKLIDRMRTKGKVDVAAKADVKEPRKLREITVPEEPRVEADEKLFTEKGLNDREKQVMRLLFQGFENHEIAKMLDWRHRGRIVSKQAVDQAARRARAKLDMKETVTQNLQHGAGERLERMRDRAGTVARTDLAADPKEVAQRKVDAATKRQRAYEAELEQRLKEIEAAQEAGMSPKELEKLKAKAWNEVLRVEKQEKAETAQAEPDQRVQTPVRDAGRSNPRPARRGQAGGRSAADQPGGTGVSSQEVQPAGPSNAPAAPGPQDAAGSGTAPVAESAGAPVSGPPTAARVTPEMREALDEFNTLALKGADLKRKVAELRDRPYTEDKAKAKAQAKELGKAIEAREKVKDALSELENKFFDRFGVELRDARDAMNSLPEPQPSPYRQGREARRRKGQLSLPTKAELANMAANARDIAAESHRDFQELIIDNLDSLKRMKAAAKARGLRWSVGSDAETIYSRLMNADREIAGQWERDGAWTIHGGKREVVGLPLATILEPLQPADTQPYSGRAAQLFSNPGQISKAEVFAVARHVADEAARGRPPLEKGPMAILADAMTEFQRDPEFVARATEFHDLLTKGFNSTITALAGDGIHFIPAPYAASLIAERPTYLPLSRDFSGTARGVSKSIRAVFLKKRGTESEGLIVAPMINYRKRLQMGSALMAEQIRRSSIAQFLLQPGMEEWGVVSTAAKPDPAGAAKATETLKAMGLSDPEVAQFLAMMGPHASAYFTSTPWQEGGQNIVEWRDPSGQAVRFRITDKRLYNLISGLQADASVVASIFKALAALPGMKQMNAIVRGGATYLSAAFQVRNAATPFRDPYEFFKNTVDQTSVYRLPEMLARAYAFESAVGMGKIPADKVFQLFVRERGEHLRMLAFDNASPGDVYRQMRPATGVVKVVTGTADMLHKIVASFGAGELAPRFLEFVNRLKQLGYDEPRLKDMAANGEEVPWYLLQEAMNAANEVTVPFNRQGVITREANRTAAFLGPAVAGLSKSVRNWKMNRKGAALALGAYLAARVLHWLAYKDDPEYQELSPRDKYINFAFKIPGVAGFWRLPGAREADGVTGAFTVAWLEQSQARDPHFAEMLTDSLDLMTPPAPVPPLGSVAWQIHGNADWAGRPIVPMRDQKLPASHNIIHHQIPYAAGQLTGGRGQLIEAITGPEDRRMQNVVQGLGIMPFGHVINPAQSVTDVYARLRTLEEQRNLAMRGTAPFQAEAEYRVLHQAAHQIGQLSAAMKGEARGPDGRIVKTRTPTEQEIADLNRRRVAIARSVLESTRRR